MLGGIAFFAVLGLATWGIAVFIDTGGTERSEALYPRTFEVGDVERWSDVIDDEGPVLIPGLNTGEVKRDIVVNHEGDDPAQGWRVYLAHPADRDARCAVRQKPGTATYTDCGGRELGVDDLACPHDVRPLVENRTTLYIDLRAPTVVCES